MISYVFSPECGHLLNDDGACVESCRRWVNVPVPYPSAFLTTSRPLTEADLEGIQRRWQAAYGGRNLNRRGTGETAEHYLQRIIERMDWHIANLRSLNHPAKVNV